MFSLFRKSISEKRGPSFLIIGAMKAGTTSLFNYVCQHPMVASPGSKEIHYYDRNRHRGWSLQDYRAKFPKPKGAMISGEATPNYLIMPHVPRLVAHDFPQMRLIVILRDPVARAYSHYQQRWQKNNEVEEFFDLIQVEDELTEPYWKRARDDPDWHGSLTQGGSFLARGRYAEQIERWYEWFPRDRMHVMFAEELRASPEAELGKVFGHLSLEPAKIDAKKMLNRRSYPPMPSEAQNWLYSYYEGHNRRLANLLDRELPQAWNAN